MTALRHKKLIIAAIASCLAIAAAAIWAYPYAYGKVGCDTTLYIYPDASRQAVADSLAAKCDKAFARRVANMLQWMDVNLSNRAGAYAISSDDTPLSAARKIRNKQQSPVRFTFNNIRLKQQFADRVAKKLLMTENDILTLLNDSSACSKFGKTPLTIVNILLPDSYECWWNASPSQLMNTMHHYYEQFWNGERDAKARALGLSRDQIQIIASIVEEETSKRDEMGLVARLYINRLERGMLLQADPTVKFAMGDFSIRRITSAMLKTESPYNTYLHPGLPPGPIRFASKAGIDAVLNAPEHDYLYMCAKEDFSGYHNFASTYAQHMRNARKYQAELNRRGIR